MVEPERPRLSQPQDGVIKVEHQEMATTHLYCTPSPAPAAPAGGGVVLVDGPSVVPELLFTENDTNFERLYGGKNKVPFVKDAFHDHIVKSHRPAEPEDVPNLSALSMKSPPSKTPKLPPSYKRAEVDANGNPIEDDEDLDHQDGPEQRPEPAPRPTNARGGRQFVNPEKTGTKSGAHYSFTDVPARGGCVVVRLKMTPKGVEEDEAIEDEEVFDDAVDDRRTDADEFYARLASGPISEDLRNVMRQALGGMLWCVPRSDSPTFALPAHLPSSSLRPGPSSSTCSSRRSGSRETRASRRRRPSASGCATGSGSTSTVPTFSRCPTSGSTPGSVSAPLSTLKLLVGAFADRRHPSRLQPLGTPPSTASRSRWSTRPLPRSSLTSSRASGT